ncbi:MAG: hypothetical protein AAFO06_11710 [Cyanobacteria bacterium J06597_16]
MKITVAKPLFLVAISIGLVTVFEGAAQAYSQATSTHISASRVFALDAPVLTQFLEKGDLPFERGGFPGRSSDSGRGDRDNWENRREDFENEREDRREDLEDELENCRDEDSDDRRECLEDLRDDRDNSSRRESGPFGNRNFPDGRDFSEDSEFPGDRNSSGRSGLSELLGNRGGQGSGQGSGRSFPFLKESQIPSR